MTRTKRFNPHERETDKHRIRFNGEVNVGTLFSLCAILLSLYGFYRSASSQAQQQLTGIEQRLAVVEVKVDSMWRNIRAVFGNQGD